MYCLAMDIAKFLAEHAAAAGRPSGGSGASNISSVSSRGLSSGSDSTGETAGFAGKLLNSGTWYCTVSIYWLVRHKVGTGMYPVPVTTYLIVQRCEIR